MPRKKMVDWAVWALLGIVGCGGGGGGDSLPSGAPAVSVAPAPGLAGHGSVAGEESLPGKKRLPRQAQDQAVGNPELTIEIAPSVGSPPTEAELAEFGARLSELSRNRDDPTFAAMFDWDALLVSINSGVDASPSFMKAFNQGVRQELTAQGGVVGQITDQVANGGSYSFLRVADRAGHRVVRMRLLIPDGGLNYHDLFVARRPNGELRIVDFYVFVAGATLGETIRLSYILAAREQSQGLLSRLMGADRLLSEHGDKLGNMGRAAKEGRFADALAIYRTMPETMQRMKVSLIGRITAAGGLGDDQELLAAINDYRTAFPGDAGLDLLSIDSAIVRQQYDEAVAAVDRLDKAVGADPYLEAIRMNIHLMQGASDRAREAADRLIEKLPEDPNSYYNRIDLALAEKDFEAVARGLDTLRDRFGAEFEDLNQIPEYAEFVASEPGRAWLKREDAYEAAGMPEERLPPRP